MQVRMGQVKPIVFTEDDCEMTVRYSNRGDPYQQGAEFCFEQMRKDSLPVWVLLDRDEVTQLRDKLNEFLESKD